MKFVSSSLLAAALLLSATFSSSRSALAQSAPAPSTTWTLDSNHTQSNFVVKHLTITNVRGAISNVKGTVVWDPRNPSKSSVEAVLDATTIDTQSAYRDKDLKGADWFNVEKYPTLTFKSTSVQRVGKGLKIAGTLSMAGVTRPVVLDATEPTAPQKGMQGGLVSALEAKTTVKRSEFNIGSKYPNAVVSDDIQITIDVEMDQK